MFQIYNLSTLLQNVINNITYLVQAGGKTRFFRRRVDQRVV